MSSENSGKIEVGGDGLGLIDISMIEQRAAELAKMDGRHFFTDKDIEEAKLELLGSDPVPPPPESGGTTAENLTSWDDLIGDPGGQVQNREPVDEANLGEALVQEGLEEADHDVRLSASNEFPPDEEI
ncbi:MAG: hypothetical protein V4710_16355 [Verrucomicrobiota bacterium]